MGIRIDSVSFHVPEATISNDDLSHIVETSDEWITERTGIATRHLLARDQSLGDICVIAARNALRAAGVSPRELDYIVCTTSTPDSLFPSTASFVQHAIGAKRTPCFDVEAGCPGFLYGIEIVRGLLAIPNKRRVLLIGADGLTRVTDWSDRGTCVLFGDAAGAAVVSRVRGAGSVKSVCLRADGGLAELLYCESGIRNPASGVLGSLRMQGRETFRKAVRLLYDVSKEALDEAGVSAGDIAWLVPHQANVRIIDALAERMRFDRARICTNIDRYGNTSAASIPICLTELHRAGKLKRGDLVMLASFGAGFVWGAMVLKW